MAKSTDKYRIPEYDRDEILEALGLVGVSEIAKRAGVGVSTVTKWTQRHADFPAPVIELAQGRIWSWAEVGPWVDRQKAKPTGRPRKE